MDKTATAEGGNEEKTKYCMSQGTVRFILSMGGTAAPVHDAADSVPVGLRERVGAQFFLRQAQVRRELCERGYVQQDHEPEPPFFDYD